MAASKRKRESKQVFDEIKAKTKEIINNRKKINSVIDLLSFLEVHSNLVIKSI